MSTSDAGGTSEASPKSSYTPHKLCLYCQAFAQELPAFIVQADEEFALDSKREWHLRNPRACPPQKFSHCSNIGELQVAVGNGCHLCTLLYNNIRASTKQSNLKCPETRSRRCALLIQWNTIKGILQYSVNLMFETGGQSPELVEPRLRLTLHTISRSESQYTRSPERYSYKRIASQGHDEIFTSALSSASTESEACFRLARHWLSICVNDHEKCGTESSNSRRPRQLPTRLVDVGTDRSNSCQTVKLFITGNIDVRTQYLTLSHCWGKLDPIKLRSANMDELINGFQLSHLPKTFQDAVHITRKLGYQYLWIDALCIIQDSPIDWSKEALRMSSVYEHAVCNIGALNSTNSDGGCFTILGNPLKYISCRLIQGDAMLSVNGSCEDLERDRAESVLNSRAW